MPASTYSEKSYGEALRRGRKNRGFTQEQLAEIMHVDTKTVYRWEADIVRPSLKNVLRLEDILAKYDGLQHPFYASILGTGEPVALLDSFAIFRRANEAFLTVYCADFNDIVGMYAPDVCEVWSDAIPECTGEQPSELSISDIESIELLRREDSAGPNRVRKHTIFVSRMEKFSTLLLHRVETLECAGSFDPTPKISRRIS